MPETINIDFFKGYAPIKKSVEKDGNWYIAGTASDPTRDWDGESVDPKGIDITYLMKQGKINYEHNNNLDHIIGEPTENTRLEPNGLYVEAMLYKDSKLANDAWNLANAMKKSNAKRSLGFSIEGFAKKNPNDPSKLDRVRVTNVAVTANPANPDATWETFTKSVSLNSSIAKEFQQIDGTSDEDISYVVDPNNMHGISSLKKENIPKAINYLTYVSQNKNKDELLNYAQKELDKKGLLNDSAKKLILHLGRGLSSDEASKFLGKEH